MDPSKNPIASESFSKDHNTENMRRLKVNAQVTAVTTLLESLGNLIQWTIWICFTKFAGHATLIQSILLYFVILPYAFLKNTNENKHRIVDEGWTNVVKNIFNLSSTPKSTMPATKDTKEIHQGKIQKMIVWSRNISGKTTTVEKIHEQKKENFRPCLFRNNCKDNDIQIFTIFQNLNLSHSISPDINIPTTSVQTEELKYFRGDRMLHSENHSNRQVQSLREGVKLLSLRHEIINDMISSVTDENNYIEHFTKLIRFEEAVKLDDDTWRFFQKTLKMPIKGYIQDCIKETSSEDSFSIETDNAFELKTESNNSFTPNFRGKLKDRIDFRSDKLQHLLRLYKDTNAYNEFLETFINMEEEFVI